ncbi:hypothetical protein OS493_021444 [Desmophyllum pertusum]|uniref:Uncharacterized protein n=1 Tax=Desmophyllum pertusum TaxID=174260 RepID=A0A9W9YYU4_9CNID|nr:hypothetical protein OS493_021444 [Desmophyllum pertusum]
MAQIQVPQAIQPPADMADAGGQRSKGRRSAVEMPTGHAFCLSQLLLILLTFLSSSGRQNDFSRISSDSVYQPTKSGSSAVDFSLKYHHSSSSKHVRHLASVTRGRRYLNSRTRYYANSDSSFQQTRLFISGDVSLNPGPISNTHKCSVCSKTIARNHRVRTEP